MFSLVLEIESRSLTIFSYVLTNSGILVSNLEIVLSINSGVSSGYNAVITSFFALDKSFNLVEYSFIESLSLVIFSLFFSFSNALRSSSVNSTLSEDYPLIKFL